MTDLRDFICRNPEYSRGRADADADISQGRLALRDFSPSPAWWDEAVKLLESRHQIKTETIDVRSDNGLIVRSIGYNDRMREHAISVFGSDVFQKAYEDAQHNCEESKDQ